MFVAGKGGYVKGSGGSQQLHKYKFVKGKINFEVRLHSTVLLTLNVPAILSYCHAVVTCAMD